MMSCVKADRFVLMPCQEIPARWVEERRALGVGGGGCDVLRWRWEEEKRSRSCTHGERERERLTLLSFFIFSPAHEMYFSCRSYTV